jgi:tetratricopeptide (TPR) repeat protein
MSKTFINGLAVLLGIALLHGCASVDTAGSTAAGDRAAMPYAAGDAAAMDDPEPEVSTHNRAAFVRATELLRSGRLVEAEALLLQVTDDQPELAGPWINLARVFVAQDREDSAVAALDQAVLANPGNCAARTELGVLLRRRGEFDTAEAHYLACLERRPDYEAAYLNLGILYDLYLGRLADALAAYRQYQSLAVEPDRQVDVWVVDLQRRLDS